MQNNIATSLIWNHGDSGMGLATAKMLLDGGARVLVTGRSKEALESAQKELGNEAIVKALFTAEHSAMECLEAAIGERLGMHCGISLSLT